MECTKKIRNSEFGIRNEGTKKEILHCVQNDTGRCEFALFPVILSRRRRISFSPSLSKRRGTVRRRWMSMPFPLDSAFLIPHFEFAPVDEYAVSSGFRIPNFAFLICALRRHCFAFRISNFEFASYARITIPSYHRQQRY